jgi:V/A-type H+-transporting ATPase subunit C
VIFKELFKLAPDKNIVDFFRIKYDYHNAKVLLKGVAANKDESRLFSSLGRISSEKLIEAFREGKKDSLPPVFMTALLSADDTLSRTGDPRLSDFILDKAYLKELVSTALLTRSEFLIKYARLWADSYNFRALVRMIRSEVDADKLDYILSDGGSVGTASIKAAYPDVLPLYKTTALAGVIPNAEKALSGGGFSSFEKSCAEVLDDYMKAARYQGFGENTLIYYLYQVESLRS